MSEIRVNTLKDRTGKEVTTTKAFCNLDGSGTAAIRSSLNISGITDNATGKFTHAFTNSFSDVNSITSGSNNQADDGSAYNRYISLPGAASASQVVTWGVRADNLSFEDPEFLQFAQHGNLA